MAVETIDHDNLMPYIYESKYCVTLLALLAAIETLGRMEIKWLQGEGRVFFLGQGRSKAELFRIACFNMNALNDKGNDGSL